MIVPESRDPKPGRVDIVGVLLSIVGLIGLVYGIVVGGDHGFGQLQAWGSIVGGIVVLAAFVIWERRIEFPSLDVKLFRNPRFSASVGAVGLVFFAAMGTLFFMSFYLQLVRGYSPLQAGLLYVPFAAAQLIFAPRSATYVRRYGPKVVCAVGLAIAGLAIAGYLLLGATTPIWVLGVLFFFQGLGMANVMPPATESIMASLPREKAGVGSAIGNTVRQVAGALGIAILGSLLSAVYRSNIGGHLSAIPAGQRSDVGNSVASTYAAAEHASPSVAGQLIGAGNNAFVSAMHWASLGAAIAALIGVIVVIAWLPTKAALAAGVGKPAPEPLETLGEQFELAEV